VASEGLGCDRLLLGTNVNYLANLATAKAPPLISVAGNRAAYRFLEFFTAQIRNPHTRQAYVRAVGAFCAWLEAHGVPSIADVGSIHVAAYIEEVGHRHSAPTVKQHLAAIRMMFDWLATGGILPFNPATAVRGPKHVVKRGKTPCSPQGGPRVSKEVAPAVPMLIFAAHSRVFLWAIHPEAGHDARERIRRAGRLQRPAQHGDVHLCG